MMVFHHINHRQENWFGHHVAQYAYRKFENSLTGPKKLVWRRATQNTHPLILGKDLHIT